MRYLIVLGLLLAILSLTACDTAVSRAKAGRIRAQAAVIEAEAAATQEATYYAAARHADTLAVLEITQPTRAAAKANLIWWSSVAAIGALMSCTIIAVSSFAYISAGYARATVASADFRRQQIRIDPGTRTYPLLLTSGGRVVDFEMGAVYSVNEDRLPDPARLMISARVREGGLYADAATRMAKATRDGQAGDALGIIAGNVPVLE